MMVLLCLIGSEFIHLFQSNMKNKLADINLAAIEIGDKKIIFSPKAIQILNVIPGNRISINYIQKNNEETFPVIGKSEIFVDPENGQKLTKSGTISFRGTQRDLLEQFGGLFKLEPYVENMYRLIAIEEIDLYENEEDFKDEINNLNKINYGNV